MNRRQLLRRGLFGGAILAGAGFGLAWWGPSARFAPTVEPRFLSRRALTVLAAIASRVIPGCNPQAVAAGVDASLVGMSDKLKGDVEGLLSLFDNALSGLLFDGRLAPFSTLGDTEQDAVLDAWRRSRFVVRRTGYQVLRKLVLSAYLRDRSTHAGLGYPGPRPTGGLFYDDSKMGVPS